MDKLSRLAAEFPASTAAQIENTGASISYLQLHERSARLSRYLMKSGLRRGDSVAVLTGESLAYFEVLWAARRSGVECVSINDTNVFKVCSALQSEAVKMLFVSCRFRQLLDELPATLINRMEVVFVDGSVAREIVDGYEWTVGMGPIPQLLELPQ